MMEEEEEEEILQQSIISKHKPTRNPTFTNSGPGALTLLVANALRYILPGRNRPSRLDTDCGPWLNELTCTFPYNLQTTQGKARTRKKRKKERAVKANE